MPPTTPFKRISIERVRHGFVITADEYRDNSEKTTAATAAEAHMTIGELLTRHTGDTLAPPPAPHAGARLDSASSQPGRISVRYCGIAFSAKKGHDAHAEGDCSAAAAVDRNGVARTRGILSVSAATESGGAAVAEGQLAIAAATGRNATADAGAHSIAATTNEHGSSHGYDRQSVAVAAGPHGRARVATADSVAVATNLHGMAAGPSGSVLVLIHRHPHTGHIHGVWSGIVGQSTALKPHTFYGLNADGDVVEVP